VIHAQDGLRLVVQAGMSNDLWLWLMDQGWCVETYRPDRRAYKDIAPSYVTCLIDSHPSQREKLMDEAIVNAQSRDALARTK